MEETARRILESDQEVKDAVRAYFMWSQIARFQDELTNDPLPLVPSKMLDVAWHAHQVTVILLPRILSASVKALKRPEVE